MTARLTALKDAEDKAVFALVGDLSFQSVTALSREADELLQDQGVQNKPSICIDLAQVSRSDSAGVALLLDWLRQAHTRQQSLQFVNIPAQMQALIQVAALDSIFAVKGSS